MARYKDPTTGFVSELSESQVSLNPQLFGSYQKVTSETPVTTTQERESITSANLASTSVPKITQPEISLVPAIPSAGTFQQPELGKTETQASDLIKQIQTINQSLIGEETLRAEKEKEFGLEQAKRSEEQYLTQLKQLELEAKSIPERLQLEATGRGITEGGLAPLQAGELRKVSIAANTTAALLLGAQGRVTAAQRNIDAAVRAKYGQEEAKRKALLDNLDLALKDPTLTAEQKLRAEATKARLDKEQKAEDKKKEDTKTIIEWAAKASTGGATPEQAQAIANIGTSDNPDLQKAFELYAPFSVEKKEPKTGGTEVERFKQFFPNVDLTTPQGQQQYLNWRAKEEAAERKPETPVSVETDKALKGEFGGIISSAANLVGAERGKASKQSMAEAVASGDYVSAYAQVANNVEESLTGEIKTKFANARTDYLIMSGFKNAIQEYANAGGDMGLLTGKEEDIKRKLGIDSGKATELAVQLWREFQTYRSNMTGAAFSAAESRDYASVNPTLGKSLNLNISVINGALNQLENRVTSTINARVPSAKKLYQRVESFGSPDDGLTDDEAYEQYLKIRK